MGKVGLVVHSGRAADLARDAVKWLVAQGHEPRLPAEDAKAVGLGEFGCSVDDLPHGLELAVSLGGDGTMLRAVDLVADEAVPVLGFNVGHLGYLTECDPGALLDALARFFGGDFRIEERMMLAVSVDRDGSQTTVRGLNEAWLEKAEPGHTVRVAVSIGGARFASYAADGMIVATPTGSTAYNLSARGPIVSPTLRAMILTPVSPHQLFDLSLVVEPDEEIRIEVLDPRGAHLLVDGRPIGMLGAGDTISCCAGARNARLVTFGPRDFYGILKTKFGLTDR